MDYQETVEVWYLPASQLMHPEAPGLVEYCPAPEQFRARLSYVIREAED